MAKLRGWLVPVLAVVGTLADFLWQSVERYSPTMAILEKLTAEVTFRIDPNTLYLFQSAALDLRIGDQPPTSNYVCTWRIRGAAGLTLVKNDDDASCVQRTVSAPRNAFGGPTTQHDATVTVQISNKLFQLGELKHTVTIVSRARVDLRISPNRSPWANQTVNVEALIDGKEILSGYKCDWPGTPMLIEWQSTNGCKTEFRAPSLTAREKSPVDVTLISRVHDPNDVLLGEASEKITVHAPRPFHYGFVVDATLPQHDKSPVSAGFETMRKSLLDTLKRIELSTGFISIDAYGHKRLNHNIPECKNTETILEFQPFDWHLASTAMTALNLGDRNGPLTLALKNAIHSLEKNRTSNSVVILVILIRGLGKCPNQDLASYFREIDRLLRDGALRGLWLENRLLPITLARATTDAERERMLDIIAGAGPNQREGGPHAVILMEPNRSHDQFFEEILEQIVRISSSKPDERRRSCAQLMGLVQKIGSSTALNIQTEKLANFCARLPTT